MSVTPAGILRKRGISRTIFTLSLIIVGVGSGLGGYFTNSILHPGTPTIQLSGAGSSLVYPILSKWASNYNGLHSNVQINYQSTGSGAGVTDYENKVVDFAGTDAAIDALTLATINTTLTIPETIGAVVIAYNVPGLVSGLHLNENVTAQIFNGTITMWNDPAIQALNNGVNLPPQSIIPVHRSDSSGTTFIFSSYLRQSAYWKATPSKAWPSTCGPSTPPPCVVTAGQAKPQNTGVANFVLNTQYAIGYVEVAYYIQNPTMTVAWPQNKDRTSFIEPTLANITSAVSSSNTSSLPTGVQSWSSVSLILQPGSNSYPILGFTYILVYQVLNVVPLMTLDKAKALVDFIWYIIHDGQTAAPSLSYPTLPTSIVNIDVTSLQSITFNGQSVPT